MSTAARKARKRAGIPFERAQKRPTHGGKRNPLIRRYRQSPGLGLVSMAEILAGMVIRGTR